MSATTPRSPLITTLILRSFDYIAAVFLLLSFLRRLLTIRWQMQPRRALLIFSIADDTMLIHAILLMPLIAASDTMYAADAAMRVAADGVCYRCRRCFTLSMPCFDVCC